MTKPINATSTSTDRIPADAEIILGDPRSSGPIVRFGRYRAYPDGKRSALTVLGDYLVRRGIISPGAH